MAGVDISNFKIEKIIENSGNDDLQKSFVGVFPSNKINQFIDFHTMMRERKDMKHPFLISNTDRSDKLGTHWWSILDIHSRREIFLFDTFGILDLKIFFIQDDR